MDEWRRVLIFVHDLRTWYEAVLYADVGRSMLGGAFVIWDGVEKRIAWDSRAVPQSPAVSGPDGGGGG